MDVEVQVQMQMADINAWMQEHPVLDIRHDKVTLQAMKLQLVEALGRTDDPMLLSQGMGVCDTVDALLHSVRSSKHEGSAQSNVIEELCPTYTDEQLLEALLGPAKEEAPKRKKHKTAAKKTIPFTPQERHYRLDSLLKQTDTCMAEIQEQLGQEGSAPLQQDIKLEPPLTLREFQITGVQWMFSLYHMHRSCIRMFLLQASHCL